MATRIKALDKIFSQFNRKTPGLALAVSKDGRLVHAVGYGMADITRGVPNTERTVFSLASTSKQFTAFCIFLLESRGKLKLTDDVRKYVPELPRYSRTIEIRHLVHHTSGLRDYLELFEMAGKKTDYQEPQILNMLAAQKELNFLPGAEHLYSNSGYSLLATIIKRVSGMKLQDFAHQEIFVPLGMTQTVVCENLPKTTPHAAYGYIFWQRKTAKRVPIGGLYQTVGDGNGFGSALDLLLWNQNLDSGKVGGPQVMKRMHQRGILNDGTRIGYAGGIHYRDLDGIEIIDHGGSDPGYESELMRVPSLKLSIACLGNSDGKYNLGQLIRQVVAYFGRPKVTSKPKAGAKAAKSRPAYQADPSSLGRFAGLYEGAKGICRISAVPGGLSADRGQYEFELAPLGRGVFQGKDGWSACQLKFKFSAEGRPSNFTVCWNGKPDSVFHLMPPGISLNREEIIQLNGLYKTKELPASFRLKVAKAGPTLRAQWNITGKPKVNFSGDVSKSKDCLLLENVSYSSWSQGAKVFKIKLVKGAGGKIRSLVFQMPAGRVRRMVLHKI